MSLTKLRLLFVHVDSHGEPGTVCRADVGVEKDIDSSAVRMYAAHTPIKVVDESASWWPRV